MAKIKEHIICAAIWYDDGIKIGSNEEPKKSPCHFRGATFQNTNIDTGYVICGWRHGNIIAVKAENKSWSPELVDSVQGFMTSKGRFVDRWQAAYIAWMAGQELTGFNYEKSYFKKDIQVDINNGKEPLIKIPTKDGLIDFDANAFMDSKPSDLRFDEAQPFNMLYSEDFY